MKFMEIREIELKNWEMENKYQRNFFLLFIDNYLNVSTIPT